MSVSLGLYLYCGSVMTMADLLSNYLCRDSVLECSDIDATLMSSIFVGTL